MIVLTLNNITNLNVSLQIGDLIYAKQTDTQSGAKDLEAAGVSQGLTGENSIVGVLDDINIMGGGVVKLIVDNSAYTGGGVPSNSFIMFSKYNQSMGDVIGYYAKAKFVNHSTEKAEIFSVGSEVIINSK